MTDKATTAALAQGDLRLLESDIAKRMLGLPVPARMAYIARDTGLSGSMENINGEWIAESPMGTVKVEFTPKNNLGILDHRVALPSGEAVYNPMRVFPNDDGSELIFTVYQRPDVSAEMFAADAEGRKKRPRNFEDAIGTIAEP